MFVNNNLKKEYSWQFYFVNMLTVISQNHSLVSEHVDML